MYKKANSFLSILLVIILLFRSVNIPVYAIDYSSQNAVNSTQITPKFSIIAKTTTSFSITGLNANVSTTLTSNSSVSLNIKVELQKEKSSGYETIETWTKSGTGTYLNFEKTRLINLLSNYRIKVTFTAGSESTTIYRYPA